MFLYWRVWVLLCHSVLEIVLVEAPAPGYKLLLNLSVVVFIVLNSITVSLFWLRCWGPDHCAYTTHSGCRRFHSSFTGGDTFSWAQSFSSFRLLLLFKTSEFCVQLPQGFWHFFVGWFSLPLKISIYVQSWGVDRSVSLLTEMGQM